MPTNMAPKWTSFSTKLRNITLKYIKTIKYNIDNWIFAIESLRKFEVILTRIRIGPN